MTEAYLVSTICLNSSYSKSFPCKSWFVTFYIFKKKIYVTDSEFSFLSNSCPLLSSIDLFQVRFCLAQAYVAYMASVRN